MARLTEQHKKYIVTRLACFAKPSEIVAALKEEMGVTASTQQVGFYDPTNVNGEKQLSRELKDLFQKTRAKFRASEGDIAISTRTWRLQVLQRLVEQNPKNTKLIRECLEQAAKEVGDAYTNRRDLTSGGQPIKAVPIEAVLDALPGDIREAVRAELAQSLRPGGG